MLRKSFAPLWACLAFASAAPAALTVAQLDQAMAEAARSGKPIFAFAGGEH